MDTRNFTERVRKILQFARDEAAELRHEHVQPEHILLAILREGEGVAAATLLNMDINLDGLRTKIYRFIKLGWHRRDSVPYSAEVKQLFDLATSAARQLNHSYVGTEHLLLGLLRLEKGIAADALEGAGVTFEMAREQVGLLLGEDPRLFPNHNT